MSLFLGDCPLAGVRGATLPRAGLGMGVEGREALERGGAPPPLPGRAPSLRPPTVPLTPSASLNGVCNRLWPPPTALETSSNRQSNGFWDRL